MDRGYYDAVSDTSTLFWGAVIFVALVAACLLIGKAIGLRNRRRFDGRAVEEDTRRMAGSNQARLTERWQIYSTRPTSFH